MQDERAKMRHPLVQMRTVNAESEDDLATLDLCNAEPIENILARIRLNTAMFGGIEVTRVIERVQAPRGPDAPAPRVAQPRLRIARTR